VRYDNRNSRPLARFDRLTDAADMILRILHAHEAGASLAHLNQQAACARDGAFPDLITPKDLEEGMWFLTRLGFLDADQTPSTPSKGVQARPGA